MVGGHYRLVRRLGEGMFGQVYEAERTDVPEHRVALKLLSRDVYAGRNVERELVMLAAASHPNIVQLKDHGMTEHYVWLSMPLYEGETLAERLDRGTLTLREAHDIFVPIARGLQSLHDRGLRHQDVKPENIYLARFATHLHPVLLDLGVAVEKSAEFVAGTALFAAPEQLAALAGMAPGLALNEKLDCYCLAATLLYAIVGERFYPGAEALTPFAVANAFEERETAPLRDETLEKLVGAPRTQLHDALRRWLVRDPAARPTAGTLADELEVLLAQEREAEQAIERGIARQKASLRRVRVALSAFALVAAGVTAYGYSKRQTWQLASELERARAQGATTFDQLDTCVAAHQLSQQRAQQCADDRNHQKQAHQEALSALEADSDAVERELNRRLATAVGRTRTCETDHAGALRAWDEERGDFDGRRRRRKGASHRAREHTGHHREQSTRARKRHRSTEQGPPGL